MAAVIKDRIGARSNVRDALQNVQHEAYMEARKLLSTSWAANYVLIDDNDKSISEREYRYRVGEMLLVCQDTAGRLLEKLNEIDELISGASFVE